MIIASICNAIKQNESELEHIKILFTIALHALYSELHFVENPIKSELPVIDM